MVDPQTLVFLPGASLIIPECVLTGRVGDGAQRVGKSKSEQCLEAFPGFPPKQRVIDPGGRIVDVRGGRDHVKVSGQHQRFFALQTLL